MVLGLVAIAIGYAIFYWGLHHMPQYKNSRYSLWYLLGFGSLSKNITIPPGQPIQFKP